MTNNQKNLLIIGGIFAIIFLIMCACTQGFGVGRLFSKQSNANTETANPKATATPSPSPTKSPEIEKVEVDQKVYQQGYKAGLIKGRNWANDMREGRAEDKPNSFGVSMLADIAAKVAKPKDESSWKYGWIRGFKDGFAKVRPHDPIR